VIVRYRSGSVVDPSSSSSSAVRVRLKSRSALRNVCSVQPSYVYARMRCVAPIQSNGVANNNVDQHHWLEITLLPSNQIVCCDLSFEGRCTDEQRSFAVGSEEGACAICGCSRCRA